MAFKRKRIYANNTPYKKSRRYFKKKGTRRSNASSGFTSKAVSQQFFKPKRLTPRRRRYWKKGLIRYSQYTPKWFSLQAGSTTQTTPATLTSMSQSNLKVMTASGTNLTSPANWANFDGNLGTLTTVAGRVVVRGGFSEITLAHESAETVRYYVFLYFTKEGLASSATSVIGQWPIDQSTANTDIIIKRRYEGFLEANTAKTFRFSIPPHILDYNDFNLDRNVYGWCIQLANTVSATAITVTVTAVERAVFACVDGVS